MNNTDNVVVSSRVRLARNFKNIPFPQRLTDKNATALIISAAEKAADFKHELVLMSDLDQIERQALVERHLISPDLMKRTDTGALLISDDDSIAVMINEEDHIRAQCILDGFKLAECYRTIDRYDDRLSQTMPVAYDSEFGYLTACMTNVGTGMRASVMVFLPAMTFSNMIENFMSIVRTKGITVRGVYGERSNPKGCLYQLSNANSIGASEQALLENVEAAVSELCASEQGLRRQDVAKNKQTLIDRAYRAYGVLANARVLSSNEMMELVAYLKYGIALDIMEFKDIETLNQLIIDAQPANLLKIAKTEKLTAAERDIVRAALVRSTLKELK